jgi:hypothetical protein
MHLWSVMSDAVVVRLGGQGSPLAVAVIVTQLGTRRGATYYEEESTRLAPSTESLLPCSQGSAFHQRPTSSGAVVSSSVSTIDGMVSAWRHAARVREAHGGGVAR